MAPTLDKVSIQYQQILVDDILTDEQVEEIVSSNNDSLEIEKYEQVLQGCEGPNSLIAIKHIKVDDHDHSRDYVVEDTFGNCLMGMTREQQIQFGYTLADVKRPLRKSLEDRVGFDTPPMFKVRKGQAVKIGESSQYTAEEKQYHSKPQSFSIGRITRDKPFLPSVFTKLSEYSDPKTGVIFFVTDVTTDTKLLFNNILQGSGVNTFYRTHQFATQAELEEGLKKQTTRRGAQKFFNDPHDLFEKGNPSSGNEALIRAKFVRNNFKCQHCIFDDKLESKILAQFRVIDMKINLNTKFIPISFYIPSKRNPPIRPYLLSQQQEDLNTALHNNDEPKIKAMAKLIHIYNTGKSQVLNKEEKHIIGSLMFGNKITDLMKYKLLYLIYGIDIDTKYSFLKLNSREKARFAREFSPHLMHNSDCLQDTEIITGALLLSLMERGDRKKEDILQAIQDLNFDRNKQVEPHTIKGTIYTDIQKCFIKYGIENDIRIIDKTDTKTKTTIENDIRIIDNTDTKTKTTTDQKDQKSTNSLANSLTSCFRIRRNKIDNK